MVKYGTSLIRPQGGFYINYNIQWCAYKLVDECTFKIHPGIKRLFFRYINMMMHKVFNVCVCS